MRKKRSNRFIVGAMLMAGIMAFSFTGCGDENAQSSVESTISSTPARTSTTAEQTSDVNSVDSETSVEESSVVESSREEMSLGESSVESSLVESVPDKTSSDSSIPETRMAKKEEAIGYGKMIKKTSTSFMLDGIKRTFILNPDFYVFIIEKTDEGKIGILRTGLVVYVDPDCVEVFPDDYTPDFMENIWYY